MKQWIYGICALTLASAFKTDGSGIEGPFKYVGYAVEFRDWAMQSHGETKAIFIDNNEVMISPTNTFTAEFFGLELSRSITNEQVNAGTVSNPDWRLYNRYMLQTETEGGQAEGTFTLNPNLVLSVLPDGEDSTIPFFFNTTTNVALNLSNRPDDESMGIELLLRKGSGMDAGSINGSYVRFTLGNSFSGQTSRGTGRNNTISLESALMQFSGTGTFTESADYWESTRITSERDVSHEQQMVADTYFTLSTPFTETNPDSGTYSVQPDGTLVLAADYGAITNQASPDGDLVASSIFMADDDVRGAYLTVAVRQPENMTETAMDAVFYMVEFREEFSGYSPTAEIHRDTVEASTAYIFLKPDNTFSMRTDYWELENSMQNERFNVTPYAPSNVVMDYVSANVFSTDKGDKTTEIDRGTYSIGTNGEITLDFGEETGLGQISANGEYIVYGYGDGGSDYSSRALGIGVRRTPPALIQVPVAITNIAMTATGIQIQGTMPTNYPVEALFCEDIASGEWQSGGIISSETGSLDVIDDDTTNATTRFYMTTFAPW